MLRAQGLEVVALRGIKQATTSATGGDFAQIAAVALACSQVVIYNDAGTDLAWKYCDADGTDVAGDLGAITIPDGTAQPIRGISDARQVKFRRLDESDTPVTVRFLHEGV